MWDYADLSTHERGGTLGKHACKVMVWELSSHSHCIQSYISWEDQIYWNWMPLCLRKDGIEPSNFTTYKDKWTIGGYIYKSF